MIECYCRKMLVIWGNIQKIIVQWIVWSHFCWPLSYICGTWHSKSIERHAVPSGLPTSNPSFSESFSRGSCCYQFLVNPFRDVSCLYFLHVCICVFLHPCPALIQRVAYYIHSSGKGWDCSYEKNYKQLYHEKKFVENKFYLGKFVFCFVF